MAFNGSGTFSRLFNWVTDKGNAVPVTASRMDSEMDGIATGLSTAICKDGQTVATARIPLVLGASAMQGAVGGVSYSFTNDVDTGVYSPATDQVALAAGGIQIVLGTATVVTIPTGIVLKSNTTPYDAFASGTQILFQQTSAPTGWTKQTTHDDKALRVVSGTASSGGTVAFSTCFSRTATDSTTLARANLPNAALTVTGTTQPKVSGVAIIAPTSGAGQTSINNGAGGITNVYGAGTFGVADNTALDNGATSSINGGVAQTGHTHPMDIRVQYVDVIIAAKN